MSVDACSKCGARHGASPCHEHARDREPEAARKSAGQLLSAVELVASATRIAMTDDTVLALLKSRVSGHLHLHPFVPLTREHGARRMHYAHLPEAERVLALYDASPLGNGEEGFVVTARRLCWKNVGGSARMVEWHDVEADGVYGDGGSVFVAGDTVTVAEDAALLDACVDLFYVLAISSRAPAAAPSSSGVVPALAELESAPHVHVKTTAPPPAGISYTAYVQHASSQAPPSWACWKCQTPLYRTTPQCARCGAWPAPFGWLRTG